MIFITLAKIKGSLPATFHTTLAQPPSYLTVHNVFWTLGQYDFIVIFEAQDEITAMKGCLTWLKSCETQTLVAVTNEEAKAITSSSTRPLRPVSRTMKKVVSRTIQREIPKKFRSP